MLAQGEKWETYAMRFRWPILIGLLGLGFIGLGLFMNQNNSEEIQIAPSQENGATELIAEVAGAVNSPGVYKFDGGSRIADLIKTAGGLNENADILWVEKNINQASEVKDGQKIYIPVKGEQSTAGSDSAFSMSDGLININSASQKELESLWGIGPVTAQNIIEQRPYSEIEELVQKSIVKQNIYERIKEEISVY